MKNILLTLLISMIFLPASAIAEYRIATIDINKVLNETSESKDAKEELSKATSKAKSQIEKQRASLKAKEDKLRKKSPEPGSAEVEAFRKEAKEFSRYVKDTEEELRRKFAKTNSELTEKVLVLVKEYAAKNDIDLILDKSAPGRGPVLFGTPQVDITQAIIAKIKN